MFTRGAVRRISILAVCILCLPAVTLAQEDPPKAEEEDSVVEGLRCVSSRPIRKTEVLDDQNILFYMRGTAIYLNHLPKPCKRLAKEGRFVYRTTVARLCRSDTINILTEMGSGMGLGRSCKLGRFYAITKEDVEKLKTPPELEARPIPPAEPEVPENADNKPAEPSDTEQK